MGRIGLPKDNQVLESARSPHLLEVAREVSEKGGLTMPENKKRSTVYLPEPLYERLRRESYETKESQAVIVEKALQEYFQRKDKPGE